jgi:hypothetical protein
VTLWSTQQAISRLRALRLVGVFVGLAGLCAALTILWWSMRAVIEIGGSCGSGNTPYEIARPCPQGIPALMTGSILGGIVMLFVYVGSAAGGPSLWPLAWPALFLSLGWNFLEYGLDPPGAAGVAPGWLLCAVIFLLMGAVPLWLLLRTGWFGRLLTGRHGRGARSWPPTPTTTDATRPAMATVPHGAFMALQVAAIVVGVWAGWRIFDWANG